MLKMQGISKSFPGVKALDNVSFSVAKGTFHGLVGENGAGKSTLMKILSGAYSCDEGHVTVDGEEIKNSSPALMLEKGVAVIYQELMLLEHQSVTENILIGNLPRTRAGFIDYAEAKRQAKSALERIGVDLNPDALISDLSVAKRQMVEIAKAMNRHAKIVVLDEPTAVLGDSELQVLFSLVKRLAKEGITFVYISHRLKEIFELCDDLTILKDGKLVESGPVSEYNTDLLVMRMVGREMRDIYPSRKGRQAGDSVLEVKGISRGKAFRDVSFDLKKGEILGVAGLAGAGRTEILRGIIGADKLDSGEVLVRQERVHYKSPANAIADKISIVPEERKTQGLSLKQDMVFNTCIQAPQKFSRLCFLSPKQEEKNTREYIKMFQTRPGNPFITTRNMSGGNQQKVVLSKCLTSGCEILLVDEPTRGIDVGAKQEIYRILNDLVLEGMAIVMVSSELPELLGMCDRILVMNEGKMTGMVPAMEASEEVLMALATK